MGGTALTNEYFDASWYELQVLVNSGNHQHLDRTPVDWVYVIGRFQSLYRESRRPEPARLLVALIKWMQSTDPRIGPDDVERGWRPTRSVDPAIMVLPAWAPMFEPLPSEMRPAITESLLTAWLVGGLFLDGWAHAHGKVDQSFFTPWHAVFYSGFAAVALALLANIAWRRIAEALAWGQFVGAYNSIRIG